jgi:hypothetical protein
VGGGGGPAFPFCPRVFPAARSCSLPAPWTLRAPWYPCAQPFRESPRNSLICGCELARELCERTRARARGNVRSPILLARNPPAKLPEIGVDLEKRAGGGGRGTWRVTGRNRVSRRAAAIDKQQLSERERERGGIDDRCSVLELINDFCRSRRFSRNRSVER